MTEGPFKGLRGPVLAVGDGEVEVSLVVMGQPTPVTVPSRHFVAVAEEEEEEEEEDSVD